MDDFLERITDPFKPVEEDTGEDETEMRRAVEKQGRTMTDSKVEQIKILRILQSNRCKDCISWDAQGHFCYADMVEHCELAKQIDALYSQPVSLVPGEAEVFDLLSGEERMEVVLPCKIKCSRRMPEFGWTKCLDCMAIYHEKAQYDHDNRPDSAIRRNERSVIFNWGNECCPHKTVEMNNGSLVPVLKRECDKCWDNLKQGNHLINIE